MHSNKKEVQSNTSLGEGASPYEDMKNSRTKIHIATWNSLGVTDGSPRAHCITCPGVRLKIRDEADGKVGWCHSCNTNYPLDKVPNTETGIGNTLVPRYTSRYGQPQGKSHSFIISQKGKKKTQEEIEREQVGKELGKDGVTVIDSKEQYYENGSWH